MSLASPLPPSESISVSGFESLLEKGADVYFSADVETDGPIPGPFSMLAVGVAVAGAFDGSRFVRPSRRLTFYRELKPISERYEVEALAVNGLDRGRLCLKGAAPEHAMHELAAWVTEIAGQASPVLVAYPLSFDWTWLYWYFLNFTGACPFNHSRCFDLKTAFAVKAGVPVSRAGRKQLPTELQAHLPHTHNALDDALEQAEIFAKVFQWRNPGEGRD